MGLDRNKIVEINDLYVLANELENKAGEINKILEAYKEVLQRYSNFKINHVESTMVNISNLIKQNKNDMDRLFEETILFKKFLNSLNNLDNIHDFLLGNNPQLMLQYVSSLNIFGSIFNLTTVTFAETILDIRFPTNTITKAVSNVLRTNKIINESTLKFSDITNTFTFIKGGVKKTFDFKTDIINLLFQYRKQIVLLHLHNWLDMHYKKSVAFQQTTLNDTVVVVNYFKYKLLCRYLCYGLFIPFKITINRDAILRCYAYYWSLPKKTHVNLEWNKDTKTLTGKDSKDSILQNYKLDCKKETIYGHRCIYMRFSKTLNFLSNNTSKVTLEQTFNENISKIDQYIELDASTNDLWFEHIKVIEDYPDIILKVYKTLFLPDKADDLLTIASFQNIKQT